MGKVAGGIMHSSWACCLSSFPGGQSCSFQLYHELSASEAPLGLALAPGEVGGQGPLSTTHSGTTAWDPVDDPK